MRKATYTLLFFTLLFGALAAFSASNYAPYQLQWYAQRVTTHLSYWFNFDDMLTNNWWNTPPPYHSACLETNHNVVVCAASAMAKHRKDAPITLEHSDFDLSDQRVSLYAAKNETVAFQLLFQTTQSSRQPHTPNNQSHTTALQKVGTGTLATSNSATSTDTALAVKQSINANYISNTKTTHHATAQSGLLLDLAFGQWQLLPKSVQPSNTSTHPTNAQAPQLPTPSSDVFFAHYLWIEQGGYRWGPKTRVLAWPGAYPDALIPQQQPCYALLNTHQMATTPNSAASSSKQTPKTVFDSVLLPTESGQNQSMWIDIAVPKETPAGLYQQTIELTLTDENGTTTSIAVGVDLTIYDVTLPESTSITAIGELYRTYNLEGAGTDRTTAAWRNMSHCYQQLAHQHRMIFIERTEDELSPEEWHAYVQTVTPILNGTLFSETYGYKGTGENTPVSTWRTPWPQQYDVHLEGPLSENTLATYHDMAASWQNLVEQHNWSQTHFFAYVFDELDGPSKEPVSSLERHRYLAMVHEQMGLLQQTLDNGSGGQHLDLLWTSHSDPAQWQDDPALDLTNKVRLWSPNGAAANTDFLTQRSQQGDQVWFYHSGHPAVGAHSINVSGIDMRTWGVIGARYGFQGQLMWSVNLGNDEHPFAQPSYKPDDDRVGNGVMVYPGNQLDKLGLAKTPGALPSMRLKAWRQGLQDAELAILAAKHNPQTTNALLHSMIPAALGDARGGKAQWPNDAATWIDFHQQLLIIASETPSTE